MMGVISEMINKKQTITGEYYPSLIFNYLYKKKENVFNIGKKIKSVC